MGYSLSAKKKTPALEDSCTANTDYDTKELPRRLRSSRSLRRLVSTASLLLLTEVYRDTYVDPSIFLTSFLINPSVTAGLEHYGDCNSVSLSRLWALSPPRSTIERFQGNRSRLLEV